MSISYGLQFYRISVINYDLFIDTFMTTIKPRTFENFLKFFLLVYVKGILMSSYYRYRDFIKDFKGLIMHIELYLFL